MAFQTDVVASVGFIVQPPRSVAISDGDAIHDRLDACPFTDDLGFLLDLHYSDTWADPGHQVKPAAWADLHGKNLEQAVHHHTQIVVAALKKQGTLPDIVQIGNEISNGLLWPDGKIWESRDWASFCGLIKAGIAGVKEMGPTVKIMIHLAWGGQNAKSRSFFDKALAQGVKFDILGQSYYPRWHGTLDDLKANLTVLAGRYKQDIMLVEYSVPNIREINDIVHVFPSGKGLGNGVFVCLDGRTGEENYRQQLGGNCNSTPVASDRHISREQ